MAANNSVALRRQLLAALFAQLVSLLLCCTSIANSVLEDSFGINIPTSQSVCNYVLLALIFVPVWLCRAGKGSMAAEVAALRQNWWKYGLIALADVEANYFIVKAYSLTIMTTIQVIDAFILPVTVLLSVLFLKRSFKANHVLGLVGCMFGCFAIIVGDVLVKTNSANKHRLLGDFYCLLSSLLYAVSNVGTEMLVRSNSKAEFLSMLGIFGSLISAVQMCLLERDQIRDLLQLNSIGVWLMFALYAGSMVLIYGLIPCAIEMSSAAFLNVNLLTADFYSVLIGVLFKNYQLHALYFVGFVCILLSTIMYSLAAPIDRGLSVRPSGEDAVDNNESSKATAVATTSTTTPTVTIMQFDDCCRPDGGANTLPLTADETLANECAV